MTETQAIGPAIPGGWLPRFTAFMFDGVVYLTFLFTILYAIGFVSGLVVPKAIDTGGESGGFEAACVNLVLMSLLPVQHSGVVRDSLQTLVGAFYSKVHGAVRPFVVRKPGAVATVLAMACDTGRRLAHRGA